MFNKSTLLAGIILSLGSALYASSPQVIVNKGLPGETLIQFKEFSRIDFKDGMIKFDTEDERVFALSSLSTMHFDDGSYAFSGVPELNGSSVRLVRSLDAVVIEGVPVGSPLQICSLTGSTVMRIASYDGGAVSIAAIPSGVYVLRVANQTFKFIK